MWADAGRGEHPAPMIAANNGNSYNEPDMFAQQSLDNFSFCNQC